MFLIVMDCLNSEFKSAFIEYLVTCCCDSDNEEYCFLGCYILVEIADISEEYYMQIKYSSSILVAWLTLWKMETVHPVRQHGIRC